MGARPFERLALLGVLGVLQFGCGASEAPSAPAVAADAHPHVVGAAIRAPAIPAPEGPSFACPGPLDACIEASCSDGMACAGGGNYACGVMPPLGKRCPEGMCELAGDDLGTRVCLPDGCCGAESRLPPAPGCPDPSSSARFEIERGDTKASWLTCLGDSTGRSVNDIGFRDGSRLIYTFVERYAERIGARRTVRGFLKLPHDKLGGALIAFGAAATQVRNPFDQQQIVAPSAHLVPIQSGEHVAGNVVFNQNGRERANGFGDIEGEDLPKIPLVGSCGTDEADEFLCSYVIGVDDAPTWLFTELNPKREIVDAFVARSRADGADVFVATRVTLDAHQRVDFAELQRLGRVNDADPGDVVLRITMDP